MTERLHPTIGFTLRHGCIVCNPMASKTPIIWYSLSLTIVFLSYCIQVDAQNHLTLSSVSQNVHCNHSGCPQELSRNTLWKHENKVSQTGVQRPSEGGVEAQANPISAITSSLGYYNCAQYIHYFWSDYSRVSNRARIKI